ncbi:hypothetical protein Tco_0145817 [Tanacetum coccineum]
MDDSSCHKDKGTLEPLCIMVYVASMYASIRKPLTQSRMRIASTSPPYWDTDDDDDCGMEDFSLKLNTCWKTNLGRNHSGMVVCRYQYDAMRLCWSKTNAAWLVLGIFYMCISTGVALGYVYGGLSSEYFRVVSLEPLSKIIEVSLHKTSGTKESNYDVSNFGSLRAGEIISGRGFDFLFDAYFGLSTYSGRELQHHINFKHVLKMKQRTLTCAPTNVAIVQLDSSVSSLVKESYESTTAIGDCFYSLGDVVLFGNMERLKFSSDMEEIYLDHWVKRLAECLGLVTSLKDCIRSMIDLLEICVSKYYTFIGNELLKDKQLRNKNEGERTILELKSFVEFVQERLRETLEDNGIKVSREKTEYLRRDFGNVAIAHNEEVNICIRDNILQPKESFRYLGLMIHKSGRIGEDVSHRIKATWLKWRAVTGVMCDRSVPLKLKGKLYRVAIRAFMLYGSE